MRPTGEVELLGIDRRRIDLFVVPYTLGRRVRLNIGAVGTRLSVAAQCDQPPYQHAITLDTAYWIGPGHCSLQALDVIAYFSDVEVRRAAAAPETAAAGVG